MDEHDEQADEGEEYLEGYEDDADALGIELSAPALGGIWLGVVLALAGIIVTLVDPIKDHIWKNPSKPERYDRWRRMDDKNKRNKLRIWAMLIGGLLGAVVRELAWYVGPEMLANSRMLCAISGAGVGVFAPQIYDGGSKLIDALFRGARRKVRDATGQPSTTMAMPVVDPLADTDSVPTIDGDERRCANPDCATPLMSSEDVCCGRCEVKP